MGAPTFSEAARELARRDEVFARLVELHGPIRLQKRVAVADRFATLVEAIVYQQLAGSAARAIHTRLVTALDGEVSPERVLESSPDELRGCGLSRAKAEAIWDLSVKVCSGQVLLSNIGRMQDDDVVDHLVQVRGIGRWTAEMFLMFTLRRVDVWPTGDYGVRVGYAKGWGLPAVPTPKELDVLGEPYRPYRSAVAWYCWRAAEQKSAVTGG